MDYSPPGLSVHGIFQARILEWVAITFSRGSSWLRDRALVSCIASSTHQQLLVDSLPTEPPYWMAIMCHGTEAVQCSVMVTGLESYCQDSSPELLKLVLCPWTNHLKKKNYLFLAMFGISCSTQCPRARGFLVPRPGIKHVFPALEGGFLITGPPGQSLDESLNFLCLRFFTCKMRK